MRQDPDWGGGRTDLSFSSRTVTGPKTAQQKQDALLDQQAKYMTMAYEHDAKFTASLGHTQTAIDRQIASQLDGARFHRLGWSDDLSFEIPEFLQFDVPTTEAGRKSLAATIAFGDQVGDAARGIAQFMKEIGVADIIDEEEQDAKEEIMRQLYYGGSRYSFAAKVGAVAGAIAEPIGIVAPFYKLNKLNSVSKAVVASAIMGGAYGGSQYVDGNESRLSNAALGAALGGPLGYWASKHLNHVVGSEAADNIQAATKSDEADALVFSQWSENAKQRAKAGNIDMNVARAKMIAQKISKDYDYDPVTKRYGQKTDHASSQSQFEYREAERIATKQAEEGPAWSQNNPQPRGRMYSKAEVDGARTKVEKEVITQLRAEGYTLAQARKLARAALDDSVDIPAAKAPKKPSDPQKWRMAARRAATERRHKQKLAEKNREKPVEEVMDEIETKAGMEGGRHSKVNKIAAAIDHVIRPIYDTIKQYSPVVAAKLREADALQHRRQHLWSQETRDWQEWVTKGLSQTDRLQLKKLLYNGGFNKATMQFIRERGGDRGVGAAKSVQKTLSDILKMYKDVGYKVEDIKDYFPRAVKDLEGLQKRDRDLMDEILRRAKKNNDGKELTAAQKAHVMEHYLSFDTRYSKTSGSLQGRKKPGVDDDELQFYHNPEDVLHFYIHTAAEDIAKRQMFRSFGHKPKSKNGLNPTGVDIDESIDSLIQRIQKDVPDYQTQQEMVNLLRARFGADVHKTHKFVQALKNLSYAGTLGNYWSAMTQIGDLVFAFHKYGIRATVGAIMGPKMVSRSDLGVEKAMTELVSETKGITSKLADWSFKWSGFDKIDRFGKNVNINASLRKNKRLAEKDPEAFKKKWGITFGDETDSVISALRGMDIKRGNKVDNDNIMLMLWNDLADTQPIGLSEMPMKYLQHPNGRIFYAYKTFAMKQMNYMRNMINNDKNPFTKGYNLMMFGTAFVLANGTVDGFKDFMAGKDVNLEDNYFDNFLGLFGTSKYAYDKSEGLAGHIGQIIQPVPLMQLGQNVDKITGGNFEAEDGWAMLPIAGKINENHLEMLGIDL